MSLLDRLERTRFGKFGIPNLMRYVIGVNIVGILISLVNPMFYYSYLSLDVASILHGQVWRIFTFVLSPSGQFGGTGMVSLLVCNLDFCVLFDWNKSGAHVGNFPL